MGLLNSPLLGSPLYGHGWSFWVFIWISALVSATLGLIIGAPTLRVRGDYLAIITLGFGEIIPVFIRNLGDVNVEIGSWKPVQRLNLTGGENGVNPVGRPYLPGVDFDNSAISWYFLILIIGAATLCAMNRLRDSRLGRAWMAIREDETAADCMGVNPIKTKLLAFALGASFSGFAGSFYAAKLQAITPGAFEFKVSIILLCMVVLGGMGSLKGVIVGGMLITLFDRLLLAQMTHLVRWVGAQTGIAVLTTVDLTLWRWFFFGLGLVLVMLFKPEGLVGRRVRSVAVDVDETEEAGLLVGRPGGPRAESIPAWLRSAGPPPDAARPAPARGARRDPGLRGPGRGQRRRSRHPSALDRRPDRPERGREDDVLQRGHGTPDAGPGRDRLRRPEHRGPPPQRHRRARHRPDVPVDPALPEHDRPRQHPGRRALPALGLGGRRRLPAAASASRRSSAPGPGRGSSSRSSASGARTRSWRRISPTATSAGSRSPARSPPSPSSCCSTSRPPG